MDFSARRARTLARLSAYALLATFALTLVSGWLPVPLGDEQRVFALLTELIANSTVPVVAIVLLYQGLVGGGLPAFWEWRLLRLARPLLRLAALLYLLTAVVLVAVVMQVERNGVGRLDAELRSGVAGLQRLRQGVQTAPDGAALQQLLASQPGLLQALDAGRLPPVGHSPPAEDGATALLSERRRQALLLLERAETNLRAEATRRRADASGNLVRQATRLGLSALVYAAFHLLASLLWPRSLLDTRERILEARAARQAEENEEREGDDGQPAEWP